MNHLISVNNQARSGGPIMSNKKYHGKYQGIRNYLPGTGDTGQPNSLLHILPTLLPLTSPSHGTSWKASEPSTDEQDRDPGLGLVWSLSSVWPSASHLTSLLHVNSIRAGMFVLFPGEAPGPGTVPDRHIIDAQSNIC